MKPGQQGWLREMSFAKLLAMLAVFVAALAGFLVLTDPSNAGRSAQLDAPAQEMNGGSSTDASAQSSTTDPSLPAAADVLPLRAPSGDTAAPTF